MSTQSPGVYDYTPNQFGTERFIYSKGKISFPEAGDEVPMAENHYSHTSRLRTSNEPYSAKKVKYTS